MTPSARKMKGKSSGVVVRAKARRNEKMSYNITSCRIIEGELRMRRNDLMDLKQDLGEENRLPEGSFLESVAIIPREYDNTEVVIKNLWWSGEGSGNLFDTFCNLIIPKMLGKIKFIVSWEGGDSIDIFTVHDGEILEKVTL